MGPEGRDSPQVLAVEVTSARSRGGGSGGGGSGRGVTRGRVVAAIGALGALAAIVVVLFGGGGARHGNPVAARGADGVAAAYGYPLGCLSVKILPIDRTYARADLSHTTGCGGVSGYAPAIFHYVAGRWRLVPDAIGYMCFSGAVPAAVEQGLELCVGTLGRGCARIGTPGQGRPAPEFGWPCAKLPKIAGVV